MPIVLEDRAYYVVIPWTGGSATIGRYYAFSVGGRWRIFDRLGLHPGDAYIASHRVPMQPPPCVNDTVTREGLA